MRARSSLVLASLLFAIGSTACSGDDSDSFGDDPLHGGDAGPDTDPGDDAGPVDDSGSNGDSDSGKDADPAAPSIAVKDLAVRVPLHGSIDIPITVARSADAKGEILLRIEGDLPKGVSVDETELTIATGESKAVFTFSSDDEVEALGATSTLRIVATSGDLSDEATLELEVAALVTSLDGTGPGSLRDMIESAPLLTENPTIGFAVSAFPKDGAPYHIYLGTPLSITKSLAIEGPPAADEPQIVLDAQLTGRVVELQFDAADEQKEVLFSGLRFQGGKTDANGGCILSEQAILSLEKVVVAGCTGKEGGGLHAVGGELAIANSTFRRNLATSHAGGVFVQAPHKIENSLFEENESGATGGALFARTGGETKESQFIANHAKDLGGAIRAFNGSSVIVTVEDSHFEGNSAHSGGAISAVGRTTITGSTFHKNEATDEQGGAIRKHGGANILVVESTSFTENKAAKLGGAISANNDSKIEIAGCRFQKNTAEDGGAIGAVDKGDTANTSILIDSSIFEDNSVTNAGGAIFIEEGQLRLVKSTLSENRAYSGGGVFYYGEKNASFIGLSTIAKNSASHAGGISVQGASAASFFIEYSTIADNSATQKGGGIQSSFRLPAVLNLRGSILAKNRVASGGEGPDFSVDSGTPIGSIVSKGYNLLGSLAGSARTCAAHFKANDECEVDAKIAALADNGSTMKTVLPADDSPAIDAIAKADCKLTDAQTIWADWDFAALLEKDQRDLPRPNTTRCDIGAVERQ